MVIDDAVTLMGSTNWTVNGSSAQGAKMVRELSKLMLRAYNNEAEHAVHTMKPYALESTIARLEKARETISKLGTTMKIQVTDSYHRLRVEELQLTSDDDPSVRADAQGRLEEVERVLALLPPKFSTTPHREGLPSKDSTNGWCTARPTLKMNGRTRNRGILPPALRWRRARRKPTESSFCFPIRFGISKKLSRRIRGPWR